MRKRLLLLEADLKPPKAGDKYLERVDIAGDQQMLRAFRNKAKKKITPAKPFLVGVKDKSSSSFK